jgi:NAD(P)-dependent dehydrogenase (short-subunit alcohol dehydrogenase family)
VTRDDAMNATDPDDPAAASQAAHPPTRLLAGDRALVTGAASNIGRAIAQCLAREGARVLLSDLADSAGETVAAALRAEGCAAEFIAADLAEPGSAAMLAAAAIARLGRIDAFVHSACPPRREADTIFAVPDDTFDRMLAVNLKAGFVLGRDIAAHMRAQRIAGRMVYLTSLHAGTPRRLAHYSAAKAGEAMLVKELALALAADGIRVNAIAPGAVLGGGFKPTPAQAAALAAKIPMGRTGHPEEVAQAALMLLVPRFSAYVTGTTVVVDGGLALQTWIDG